jgi:hypothetical protein
MKINDIYESTTAGSIATVAAPMSTQKRSNVGKGVYGNEKAGNLLTGKKTSKKYANSVNESFDTKQKVIDYFVKNGKTAGQGAAAWERGWRGKSAKKTHELVANKPRTDYMAKYDLDEAKLDEDDLIIVPGQGRTRKTGFIKHGESRLDHEVEMARSDLFSAAKNAKQVYELIVDVSEEEGLEGWVQEKIIKANDYLNTIREYLEGKQLQNEMSEGWLSNLLGKKNDADNGDEPASTSQNDKPEQKSKSQGPSFAKKLTKMSGDFSHVKFAMGSSGKLNLNVDYNEKKKDEVYLTLQEIKLLKSTASEEKRDFREQKAELKYNQSQQVANQAPIQSIFGYSQGKSGYAAASRVSKGLQRAGRQGQRSRYLAQVEDIDQKILSIDKIIAVLNQAELQVKKHYIKLKENEMTGGVIAGGGVG